MAISQRRPLRFMEHVDRLIDWAADNLAAKSWSRFRPADLRFPKADDEAAFRQNVEEQMKRPMIVASAVSFAGLLSVVMPAYEQEVNRIGESRFHWQTADPRTLFFLAGGTSLVQAAVIGIGTTLHLWKGVPLPARAEQIGVCSAMWLVSVMYFISKWHTATMYSKDPQVVWGEETRGAQGITVLGQLCTMMCLCMYMPIRVHLLRYVPLATALTNFAVLLLVGTPFQGLEIRYALGTAFVCFMQYVGARRHEEYRRDRWLAVRRVAEQQSELDNGAAVARALETMVGTSSEVILMLDEDLRLIHDDHMHEAYFGRKVVGTCFLDLLVVGDRARFTDIVAEASSSKLIQSMPAAVCLHCANLSVQLAVVDTGGWKPKYLVGLQTCSNVPVQEGILVQEVLGRIEEERALEFDTPPTDEHSCTSGVMDVRARPTSIASTTNTGKVFSGLDRDHADGGAASLPVALSRIAAVGNKEHWLFNTDDLCLFPERVLGRGGFGVVVMARLGGTALAAKLPRQHARNISETSSILNELRIHRHVRHSNIVLFYGACIDHSSGNIAMLYELIRGPNLDAFVLQKLERNDNLTRTKLLLDVSCALSYLHCLRPTIVHGDVKSNNVLVESLETCFRAKLLDLGLSLLVTKRAKLRGGTRKWMAPELVTPRAGPPNPMPSADVYAFGFLAYFVVMRREPFTNIDRVACQGGGPPPAFLPLLWQGDGANLKDSCRQVCEACLHFDPEQRPDMAEVQKCLLLWLPPVPSELHKLGPDVLTLIMGGCSWDEAMSQLDPRTGQDSSSASASASAKRRGSSGITEELQQSVSMVRSESSWPERDTDDDSGDEVIFPESSQVPSDAPLAREFPVEPVLTRPLNYASL